MSAGILLIQSISNCLSLINMNINDIIPRITNYYNSCNLKYLEANSSIVDSSLNFLTNDRVAMIIKKARQIGYNKELDKVKVQMFIYASPWLNVDEYLKYLYYLYE